MDFKPRPETPLGQRFSLVYRARDEPSADSKRMRWRIAAALVDDGDKFEKHAQAELVPGLISH